VTIDKTLFLLGNLSRKRTIQSLKPYSNAVYSYKIRFNPVGGCCTTKVTLEK